MTDVDKDFSAAGAAMNQTYGHSVTYVRGNSEVTVIANLASRDEEASSDHGVRETMKARIYLIAVADLVIGDEAIEPRPGDKIKQEISGTVELFQVMPDGNNPAVERVDPGWTTWLIRTKHIGSE